MVVTLWFLAPTGGTHRAVSGTWHQVWWAEECRKHSHQDLDPNSGNTPATQQWVRGKLMEKEKVCFLHINLSNVVIYIFL